MPSRVVIVRFVLSYYGLNPGKLGGVPPDATVAMNVWELQTVNAFGIPVDGDFTVDEMITQKSSGQPTVNGPSWSGGVLYDNIGIWQRAGTNWSQLTAGNWDQQSFTVTGRGWQIPLSTVINQISIFHNGSLIVGGPSIVVP